MDSLKKVTVSQANVWASVGKAVEMEVVARLIAAGHQVAIPVVDNEGVDLIVNYTIKVQVKSGERRNAFGQLQINTEGRRHAERTPNSRKGISPIVDVLVVKARDSGAWWIIPCSALDDTGGRTCCKLSLSDVPPTRKNRRGSLANWRDAWWVFEGPVNAPGG